MTNRQSTSKSHRERPVNSLVPYLAEFDALLPTEEDCVEEIYSRSTEILFQCQRCSSEIIDKPHGARIARCTACRKWNFLTAGTFFHGMRNAKDWMFAIWLIERGIAVSSSAFHELTGYSQSSALILFKKIATVIEGEMPKGATVVFSSEFLSVFCKRSRLTPSKAHPRAEQEEIEKEVAAQVEGEVETEVDDTKPDADLCEQERQVYDLLSKSPMCFDTLIARTGLSPGSLSANLTMLQLQGLAETQLGAWCVPAKPKSAVKTGTQCHGQGSSPEPITMLISSFLQLASSHWRGISRRFLQKYLALFWCHTDRIRWPDGSLLDACLRFGKINRDHIHDYATPLQVKVCPFP